MHVLDAMTARRTVRTFGLRTPPRSTIESIFRNAARAPSAANDQPWRAYVYAGEPLADLVNAASAGEAALAGRPGQWAEGIARDSREAGMLRRSGLRFYEAPVGAIFTMPKGHDVLGLIGHGGFVANVCLAAGAFGLDTCIVGDFFGLESFLGAFLGLADNERITVGVGIGYLDGARPIAPARLPFEEIVSIIWS